MRSTISVIATGDSTFRVTVDEGDSRTVHEITATPQDVARYAPGTTAGRLVRASFEFLLDREAKESILSRFELPTIEQHFPEYPTTIRELLQRSGPQGLRALSDLHGVGAAEGR